MTQWSFEHGMIVRRCGSGPELVWIHGLGEWSVSFDAIARHPALSGYTHVLPDLPGYGRSPWRDGDALDRLAGSSLDHLAAGAGDARGDSLDALADHLATWLHGRLPAVLLGHSMGGVLATLVAERIRVAGVVDIDGNLSRGDCTFSAQATAYSLDDFVAHGFQRMRDDVYARGASEPALRGYHAAMCAADPRAFHRNATDLVRLSETETLVPRLAALAPPTLFVAGVPSGICAHSRELLDRHRIRTAAIEPAGHWVYIDQPAAFAAAIAEFLGSRAG